MVNTFNHRNVSCFQRIFIIKTTLNWNEWLIAYGAHQYLRLPLENWYQVAFAYIFLPPPHPPSSSTFKSWNVELFPLKAFVLLMIRSVSYSFISRKTCVWSSPLLKLNPVRLSHDPQQPTKPALKPACILILHLASLSPAKSADLNYGLSPVDEHLHRILWALNFSLILIWFICIFHLNWLTAIKFCLVTEIHSKYHFQLSLCAFAFFFYL